MTWAWEKAPVAGTELLLVLAIADSADDDGRNAWPSIADLAQKTRLNERTVQRLLKRLARDGHITIEPVGGRRRNRYAIAMSTTPTAPPPLPTSPPHPHGRRKPRRIERGGVDWPAWCGRCDGEAPHERYVDDGTGTLIPCSRCHLKGRGQPAG
ncbi:helix-turn-helix domain-containing protein [Saccharothrix obliqua]|uniref:helix-turn-helix domain-containing protein n=1 Tax=Saccharothrix obliqua TaxID=2861747 RepID=UPI001C5F1AE9|nr:helix-turn-helix domain-containing protein [Saccharothrix obliqua]MBW4722279.1 helix-turn-helix domain-containing protein [Saccharothrix obliqua]